MRKISLFLKVIIYSSSCVEFYAIKKFEPKCFVLLEKTKTSQKSVLFYACKNLYPFAKIMGMLLMRVQCR